MKTENDLAILDRFDEIISMNEFLQWSLTQTEGIQLTEQQAIGAGSMFDIISQHLETIKQAIERAEHKTQHPSFD